MSDYLLARFERGENAVCWPWRGPVQSSGYGLANLTTDGVVVRTGAHRAVYEHLVGPIPPDMCIDHGCHNADTTCPGGNDCPHRRCVNPSHLEVVTRGENSRRGRGFPAVNLARDVCPRGHPYGPPGPRGRRCGVCERVRRTSYRRAAGMKPSGKGASHCARGHEFTPENTRIQRTGGRGCKACARAAERALRAGRQAVA
jgi:hypothetical protein